MKNLKILLFLTLAASLTFVSCKKDDDDDVDDNGGGTPALKSLKVVKATKDDGTYTKYLYDADNNLVQEQYKDANGDDMPYYVTYSYTGGNMTEYIYYNNSAPQQKITVTYANGKPNTANVQVDQGAGLADYFTLDYNFSGDNLASLDFTMDIAGTSTLVQKYIYTITGSNYTRIDKKSYDGTSLADNGYEEYTFDSKTAPMHGIGLDYVLGAIEMMSVNNTTMQKYVSAADQVDQAQSVNTTYEYNADNYPTKQTNVTFDGNSTTTITFTYEEK